MHDRQTDTQNLFCPKPYKTIKKKYNARKKGKEASNSPKVYQSSLASQLNYNYQ